MQKPRLFSYSVTHDYGSAPNPFWGTCTLTICKPVIRRIARKDDWIVGLRGESVVYAMRVSSSKSLADYDHHCRKQLRGKIPSTTSRDFRRKVGDCIYYFSPGGAPSLRKGIHNLQNKKTDLSGLNALLSTDFYYFGGQALPLPKSLHPIIHKRGHRSSANESYFRPFVSWIRRQRYAHNKVTADPALKQEVLKWGWGKCASTCASKHRQEAEADERRARCGRY